MPTYNGPAVLVAPDGSEHQVQVKVRIAPPGGEAPRGDWGGDIHGDGTVLWDLFSNSQPLKLRAADGSEGEARIVQIADGAGRISGAGSPPSAWL